MPLKDYVMQNIKNNKNIPKITYAVYTKDGTAKLVSTTDKEFSDYAVIIPKQLYLLVLYALIAIPLAWGIEITLTGFIGVYAVFNTKVPSIGFLVFLQVIVGSIIIKFTRDAIVKFTHLYLEKRKIYIFSNQVPDNAKPMLCPHCGKTYYGDIQMCPHCNTIFDKNIKLFIGGTGAILVLAGLMIAQADITDIIAICLAKTEAGQYLGLAPSIVANAIRAIVLLHAGCTVIKTTFAAQWKEEKDCGSDKLFEDVRPSMFQEDEVDMFGRSKKNVCEHCGATYKKGTKICPNCGAIVSL